MLSHDYIGAEHFLLGDPPRGRGRRRQGFGVAGYQPGGGLVIAAITVLYPGITWGPCASRWRRSPGGPGPAGPARAHPLHPRARKVLELTQREALHLSHDYIGAEHILLGLIRAGECVAAQVLVRLGADLNRVRQQVIQLLHGHQARSPQRSAPIGL